MQTRSMEQVLGGGGVGRKGGGGRYSQDLECSGGSIGEWRYRVARCLDKCGEWILGLGVTI